MLRTVLLSKVLLGAVLAAGLAATPVRAQNAQALPAGEGRDIVAVAWKSVV